MNVENILFAISHPLVALRVKWARDGAALNLLDEPAPNMNLKEAAVALGLIVASEDRSGIGWPDRSRDPKTGQLHPRIGDIPQHDL